MSVFASVSYEQWCEKVRTTLGDWALERLATSLYEGFQVKPLYVKRPMHACSQMRQSSWRCQQAVDVFRGMGEVWESEACEGVQQWFLRFPWAVKYAGNSGEDWPLSPGRHKGDHALFRTLETFCQTAATRQETLVFDAGLMAPALFCWLKQRLPDLRGQWGFSPNPFLFPGWLQPKDIDVCWRQALTVSSHLEKGDSGWVWDASFISDLGGHAAQEIATLLAMAVDTARQWDERQHKQAWLWQGYGFRLTVDQDIFLSLAKVRAARRLWQGVMKSWLLIENEPQWQALAATRMYSGIDPWVNILRSTAATSAAMMSACQSIRLIPFDQFSQPHEMSQRLNRNIQLILAEESHLLDVDDPLSGSYYVESLTEELAQRSWQIFTEIDGRGGFSNLDAQTWLQRQVTQTATLRQERLATRDHPLTGTSWFASLTPFSSLNQVNQDGDVGDQSWQDLKLDDWVARCDPNAKLLSPVWHFVQAQPWKAEGQRDSEAFEELRRRKQAYGAGVGTVMVVTLGSRKDFGPRAAFAEQVFTLAEIQVQNQPFQEDFHSQYDAWRSSGAKILVLCGQDQDYEARVKDILPKVNRIDLPVLMVAKPSMVSREWTQAGIRDTLYQGMNVVDFFQRWLPILGGETK